MYFISTSIFKHLLSYASKQGINIDDLLNHVSINKSSINNIDNKIPLEDYYKLLDRTLDITGDPYMGLHMGEKSETGDLSIFGYMIACCDTIKEALEKISKYYRMMGSLLNIYLETEGECVRIVYDMKKHYPYQCIRHCVDAGLLNFYNLIKDNASEPVAVKEIWFKAERPEHYSEYYNIFYCPILFNKPVSALIYPSNILNIPLKHPDPNLLRLLEQHANSFLSKLEQGDLLSRKISLLLFQQNEGYNLTLKAIADKLRISVRTLQNRLKDEGITYKEVRTNTRKELAKSYLSNSNYTIDEISYLLGFSEGSVFAGHLKTGLGKPQEISDHHPILP